MWNSSVEDGRRRKISLALGKRPASSFTQRLYYRPLKSTTFSSAPASLCKAASSRTTDSAAVVSGYCVSFYLASVRGDKCNVDAREHEALIKYKGKKRLTVANGDNDAAEEGTTGTPTSTWTKNKKRASDHDND